MAQAAVPLLILSLVGTAASTGLQIAAQKKAAKAEKATADRAAVAEERLAKEKAEQLDRQRRRILAQQQAAVVGRGVKLSGSPLELLAETNEIVDLDINRVLRQGRERAAVLRTQGRQAVSGLKLRQAGTILGGTSQLASQGLSGTLSLKQAGLLS